MKQTEYIIVRLKSDKPSPLINNILDGRHRTFNDDMEDIPVPHKEVDGLLELKLHPRNAKDFLNTHHFKVDLISPKSYTLTHTRGFKKEYTILTSKEESLRVVSEKKETDSENEYSNKSTPELREIATSLNISYKIQWKREKLISEIIKYSGNSQRHTESAT